MDYYFPTKIPYSQDEIRQRFGVIYDTTGSDLDLHYKLIIPLTWKQKPTKYNQITDDNPLEKIAEYTSPTGPIMNAIIMVAYIKHEISPSDWLLVYLGQTGEEIVHERHTKIKGGAVPDVLSLNKNNHQISRWIVIKDWVEKGGAYLHILKVSTPLTNYSKDVANQFLLIVTNLNILHTSNWEYAERLRTLSRNKPLDFVFAYPESWRLFENPLSNNTIYQANLTKDLYGQIVSRITFAIVSKSAEPDKSQLNKLFLEYYTKDGIEFEPYLFTNIPNSWGVERAWYTETKQKLVSKELHSKNNLEIIIAEKNNSWLYLEQFSLSRNVSPEAWAVGKRAFEIILDYLKIK